MIPTVFLVCGIHVLDVLCGNYLYFSPMPSAYGPRIDLKIKFCSVLQIISVHFYTPRAAPHEQFSNLFCIQTKF